MVSLYGAIAQVTDWVEPIYQTCRSHDIHGYQPQPLRGRQPVIQYWQPSNTAYVKGVTAEPPAETKFDKRTGIIRSYTTTLRDEHIGHLDTLIEEHITDEFLGNLQRFTTSQIYDTPSLPSHRVHLNTDQQRKTLRERLDERSRT